MLNRWLSNIEKQLEENKEKLKDLKENKTLDFERYEIYSSKIHDWLNDDDMNENIQENLVYDLKFLESEPKNVKKQIGELENSIEYHEFVVTKLKKLINND